MKRVKPANKPGRKLAGGYWTRPPGDPVQKSVRIPTDLIMKVENRALEESTRLGVQVSFSDLCRRGLERVLADPLPPKPAPRMPCIKVENAGGTLSCIECGTIFEARHGTCPKNGRMVILDDE